MKKIVFILSFILLFFLAGNIGEAKVIIPDEAIRLRVIPNSNSEYDQNIKTKVKNNLQQNMTKLLKNSESIDEARQIINENLSIIDNDIRKLLDSEKYPLGYKINFGYNYFPKKEFKGVVYDEGYYESVVVTLGEGRGDNWWCVLFPPLCLMEASESDKVEYASFVKAIIDKYTK